MKQNSLNCKNEALFLTLSGYAKGIIDNNDKYLDGTAYKIALAINKEFKKNKKRYNIITINKIVAILKEWDIVFNEQEKTAPIILLVITLDYLFNELEHRETKILFGHYREDVKRLYNLIEISEYKKHLYNHLKMIRNFTE